MTDEIVEKIHRLVQNQPDESRVQHLFTLTRKLIERVPTADRSRFSLLKFYCDWTLHSDIDRSEAGAAVLGRLHEILVDHLKKSDNAMLVAELTTALSLSDVRIQLNELLATMGHRPDNVSEEKWREIIPIVAEIVSNCPITISPKTSKLAAMLAAIHVRPIKGSSVVEKLTVIKLVTSVFNPEAPAGEITYCLMLTISDTTKIVAPLVRT